MYDRVGFFGGEKHDTVGDATVARSTFCIMLSSSASFEGQSTTREAKTVEGLKNQLQERMNTIKKKNQ